MKLTIPIVDQLQFCVCCMRSAVTPYIHFVVHCLWVGMGWHCGVGVFGLTECIQSHPAFQCRLFEVIIIMMIIIKRIKIFSGCKIIEYGLTFGR